MNKTEWLKTVVENSEDFANLVLNFHPNYTRTYDMPITAPRAEEACEAVRRQIRIEKQYTPTVEFDKAVAAQDIDSIIRILNEVWFGAPESREVFKYPGFGLMCDLLSDLPEEE